MALIYHITHLRNLPSILDQGGLLSDTAIDTAGCEPMGIAHAHIKKRRARKMVPTGQGGTLAEYVPFFFAPRSPMLYVIHKGNVEGYTEGQAPILHLVSSTDIVSKSSLPFVFTDGHADVAISQFFDRLELLSKIDWEIMKGKMWDDTITHFDRKRKRQAEFLVHGFFPWTLITKIGVFNRSLVDKVNLHLESAAHQPEVLVENGWYY